ncbi:hypothetical protein DC522_04435 [Microvirga sp. KLBC 81]|uniref:hypothetical protein n=1 Tax=Microvirga sp. KLBC 81 TaxID=1862707 RepID=UPI000D519FC8|nr:hypothetical protein [Microvirga sp. KLBC 81]PVE25578.1 hypothetical protein DC522_04435 [Microvirga sp. KLBC 81]
MTNVIPFPAGTAAPEIRCATSFQTAQTVFSPVQAAELSYEDGRLYGWASRDGRLPFDYWRLEADLRVLIAAQGVVMAAHRLVLPVPFVRGWALELGLAAPGRLTSQSKTGVQPPVTPASGANCAAAPLADDGMWWAPVPGAVPAQA